MRTLITFSVLLILLTGCGVPDPAALAPPTPTISPTISASATPTLAAPITTPTKTPATPTSTQPSNISTSPAFSALPLDQLLFQPGDLPDDVTAGTIEQQIPEWAQDKMIPAPDGFAALGFLEANRPNGYGQVAVFFASTSDGIDAAYGWLGGRADAVKKGAPQPGIGDQAVLIMPNEDQGDIWLAFTLCRAAVEVRFVAPVDQQALRTYGTRLAQRLDAMLCRGATTVPLLTPPPALAPTATPLPPANITRTIQATLKSLPPTGQGIRSYSFADAAHGWLAVGATIFATTDGGATWVERFRMNRLVNQLDFRSATVGWAETQAGYFGTNDGGASWQPIPTPPGGTAPRVPEPPLRKVQGDDAAWPFCPNWYPGDFVSVSGTLAWALCMAGPVGPSEDAQLFQTRDGGKTWQVIADTPRYGSEKAFSGTLPSAKWISGLQFLDSQHGLIQAGAGLYATSDSGRTWNEIGPASEYGDQLDNVRFVTPKLGFVILNHYNDREHERLLRTDDGGATWREIYVASTTPLKPTGPTQFFADQTGIGADSNNATILRTSDAGSTWQQLGPLKLGCSPDAQARITAISFGDPQRGWAIAACNDQPQSTLYQTQDGGATWTARNGIVANEPLTALAFVDQRIGYLATTRQLLITRDGGATFQPVGNQAAPIKQLRFVAPDRGWALRGYDLFATTNGGQRWQLVALGYRVRAFDVLPSGQIRAITSDFDRVAQSYTHRLLTTSDGGQSWTSVVIPNLIDVNMYQAWEGSIRFTDPQHGWLTLANGSVFQTSDGGQRWAQLR